MSASGHGATRHGAPIHINFDDNSLLPLLFGEHDRHLARIEQKLGVSLASRGNRLAINKGNLRLPSATALKQLADWRSYAFERDDPKRLHFWQW